MRLDCYLVPLFQNFLQNFSYKNEFDVHDNLPVSGTHFHVNGSHLDSFSHRDKRQLGNSPLFVCQFLKLSFQGYKNRQNLILQIQVDRLNDVMCQYHQQQFQCVLKMTPSRGGFYKLPSYTEP